MNHRSLYKDKRLLTQTYRIAGPDHLKIPSALVKASEKAGFWTLQGGIFPENTVSIDLHKKHGFRVQMDLMDDPVGNLRKAAASTKSPPQQGTCLARTSTGADV